MQTIKRPGSRTRFGASVCRLLAAASALLALLVLLSPSQLRAQLVTGDVLGTVTDSTGAVVPGAKVTLTNTGTGIASSTTSSATGEFVFSNVQIGTFKVVVEAKGFKSFDVANIVLTAGQRLRVEAKLQVGSQVETVQVEAAAAVQLESDSSDIKSEIATSSMAEMPTNGRNYYNLVALQPGAQAGGGSGDPTDNRPSMDFKANGQSSYFNNNMIDGMDNNMVSLGSVAVEPSLDALEEVQVETSNYSAEYSRTGGGIANLITKSGTNQFHGSLFEFMRNDAFDSYQWSLTPSKTKLRQNQFGGSVGGPILKNKAFFFFDYQGWRQIQGSISQVMVLSNIKGADGNDDYDAVHNYVAGKTTTLELSDPFDAWGGNQANGYVTATSTGYTVYQNGEVFSQMTNPINPYGLAELMGGAPAPNVSASNCSDFDPASGLCNHESYNWSGPINTVQNANTYDGRIDYHINDRNTLFGRFSYNLTTSLHNGMRLPPQPLVAGNAPGWTGHNTVNPVGDDNVALDYVHIFNPTTIFEAKASYGRANDTSYTQGWKDWSLSKLGIANGGGYDDSTLPGLPGMSIASTNAPSPYTGVNTQFGGKGTRYVVGNMDANLDDYIQDTFQYSGSLTLNRKSHSIKTGITLIRRQINSRNATNGGPHFSANYTGNSLGDILEGLASSVTDAVQIPSFHGRTWEPSAYIQDDWRATKSLTLNLGIRYDIYTPTTDRDGDISNFDLNTDLVVSPKLLGPNASGPTAGVITDYKDISPRIGFAYSLNRSDVVLRNMVIRGGVGLSYFPGASGTLPGSHEYQMVNSPFTWSMECGNAVGHYDQTPCDPAFNNYLTSAQYTAQPYGIPAGQFVFNDVDYGYGGYNLRYGIPAPQFIASNATDPSNYRAGFSSNLFEMPTFRPAYLYQFNLQLQKQVGNNIVTAGFVGNIGRRLPSFQNLNTPTSLNPANPVVYPLATTNAWMTGTVVGESISEGNSAWEAGEATYERHLSKGLSASVNYTWARTEAQGTGASECVVNGCQLDNGSGGAKSIDGWQAYGYSGSTSHRAAGMVNYQMPYGRNLHGPLGAVVKGWELAAVGNWNTGGWTTITSAVNQSGFAQFTGANMQSGTEYPSKVPGVSAKPAHQTFANWVNPAAFVLQPQWTLGNATNPEVQGPRSRDVDMGIDKTFSLLEGFKLQFRAEAFNLTNTPNWSLGGGGGPGGPGGPPPGGGGGPPSGRRRRRWPDHPRHVLPGNRAMHFQWPPRHPPRKREPGW